MPHVVPSQVVEIIDRIFPAARQQQNGEQTGFSISRGNQNQLAAILTLIDEIPPALIN